MNRQQHRPQPEFQAVPRDRKAAEQRAENKHDDTDCAVNQTKLVVRQTQSARCAWVEQKRLDHFYELRLAEPVKQQKQKQRDNFWLLKKHPEGFEKFRAEIFWRGNAL